MGERSTAERVTPRLRRPNYYEAGEGKDEHHSVCVPPRATERECVPSYLVKQFTNTRLSLYTSLYQLTPVRRSAPQ